MLDYILTAHDIRRTLGKNEALAGVSFSCEQGETVAIVGKSGSGKTTLLHCLSGLDQVSSGTISLLGQDLSALNPHELSRLRLGNVGFVFQQADLVPELTLEQNIALPLELLGKKRRGVTEPVAAMMEELGLTEFRSQRPHELSGGQAQRAAIGRALIAQPRVIFADEPTGALDTRNRDGVLELLSRYSRELGALLVTVTHDQETARMHERIITLEDGRVLSDTKGQGTQ